MKIKILEKYKIQLQQKLNVTIPHCCWIEDNKIYLNRKDEIALIEFDKNYDILVNRIISIKKYIVEFKLDSGEIKTKYNELFEEYDFNYKELSIKCIGIIDADLIYRKKHRFPNLVSMKLSKYYKDKGYITKLLLGYDNLQQYDKVFISKVFTDTEVPKEVLNLPNVEYGGTGFFYDKAPSLPYEIEHHMPDYHLYDAWVEEQISSKEKKRKEFEYYLDYSIGFTTRGCFRQCPFCVNKNYKKVELHSPLEEFLDNDRKYICLLDDNILGYPKWKEIFEILNNTKKYFQYKQGMDERILTEEKCEVLSKSKYKGDFIFAFDNIEDKDIIIEKLKLWRKYSQKSTKFYVFCAFDRQNKWDEEFWKQDIIDTFIRIFILAKYNCKPYIMRFKEYEKSPYRGMYINLASWCNQPHLIKKMSFREYCIYRGMKSTIYKQYINKIQDYLNDGYNKGACWRYMEQFEQKYSDISKKWFDLKYENFNIL